MADNKELENALPPLTLDWTDQAIAVLRAVPFSVRKSAARGIESYSMTKGYAQVTPEIILESRKARQAADASGEANKGPHGGEHAPGQGGAYPKPERDEEEAPRQFVCFTYFKLDKAFRRLPLDQKNRMKAELAEVITTWAKKDAGTPTHVITRSYSTIGTRADADLMLWRISYDLEAIQAAQSAILHTEMGGYLDVTYSLTGMTKMSAYDDKLNPDHEAARLKIIPGRAKFIFVYPFVKTRDWYLMRPHARQGIMDEHIFVGSKYSRVKLNTTYSFGLDDQEFVVAFESNYPQDFLDLVQELRETESSRYTTRDTPTFTCIAKPIDEALNLMG